MIFFSCKHLVLAVILVHSIGICMTKADDLDEQKPDAIKKRLHKKVFKEKRLKHQEAVQRIVDLNDTGKQKEMVSILVNKMFEMLTTSLGGLVKAQAETKDTNTLQYNQDFLNDISTVIENTALTVDLALHFPKIFMKIYNKQPNWKDILKSSIDLTIRSGVIDEETEKGINLMRQEVHLVPREANYVNPYAKKKNERESQPIPTVPPKKKKEKKKRGPGLSGSRTEL